MAIFSSFSPVPATVLASEAFSVYLQLNFWRFLRNNETKIALVSNEVASPLLAVSVFCVRIFLTSFKKNLSFLNSVSCVEEFDEIRDAV